MKVSIKALLLAGLLSLSLTTLAVAEETRTTDLGNGVTMISKILNGNSESLMVKDENGTRSPSPDELKAYMELKFKEANEASQKIKAANPQKGSDDELIARNHLQPITEGLGKAGESSPIFTSIFDKILGTKTLDLTILDAYENPNEAQAKPGDVVRIIHLIDKGTGKELSSHDNKLLFSTGAIDVKHYKEANKGFGISAYLLEYDKKSKTFSYVSDLRAISNQYKSIDDIKSAWQAGNLKMEPIEKGSRLETIVKLVMKNMK